MPRVATAPGRAALPSSAFPADAAPGAPVALRVESRTLAKSLRAGYGARILARVSAPLSPPPDAGVHLLGPAEIRSLAAELGLRPTKQRGQNFVIDPNTVRRIVRTADVRPEDVVLEVGPGLGSLTLALVDACSEVVAIEIDPLLAARLPRTLADFAPTAAHRLHVLEADALRVRDLPGTPPTALVANLPYNVSVPVLLHLFEVFPRIASGLVMVQAEVADRLAAPPGSRTYGVPSAKAAWWADVRRAGSIGKNVFWPAPNVDSGLVAFTRREPPATTASRAAVFAVIDAAFAQRRKALRGALRTLAGSADRAEEALREAGINPTVRGEALGIAEFARLAEAIDHLPRVAEEPIR